MHGCVRHMAGESACFLAREPRPRVVLAGATLTVSKPSGGPRWLVPPWCVLCGRFLLPDEFAALVRDLLRDGRMTASSTATWSWATPKSAHTQERRSCIKGMEIPTSSGRCA